MLQIVIMKAKKFGGRLGLQGAYSHFAGPWVTGDDFNNVRSISEKRNCSRSTRYMNKFCNFIEDKEMFDPLLVGGELYMDQEPSLETSSPIDGFFCRTE